MKKLLLLLAIASPSVMAEPTIDNIREYRVEKTMDTDLVVVEFTPIGRPDMTCIYVTGGNDGGVTCFPKPKAEK